jgi:uncharacterized membrane protein YcaP (DUF421 family)
MTFLPADWRRVFAPETPLLELVARGSLLYLGILVVIRLMPRRSGGELSRMDLAFALLVTEAASNALGNYTSYADALVLIAVIMAWNIGLNSLSYRVKFIERLIAAPPLYLVRNGQLQRGNMRREFLTKEELLSHLREQGIDDVHDVKTAYLEGDGRITAIKNDR